MVNGVFSKVGAPIRGAACGGGTGSGTESGTGSGTGSGARTFGLNWAFNIEVMEGAVVCSTGGPEAISLKVFKKSLWFCLPLLEDLETGGLGDLETLVGESSSLKVNGGVFGPLLE